MTSIHSPIFDRFWSLLASIFFPKSTNIGTTIDLERYRFFDRFSHRILNGPRRPQDAPRRPKTAPEGPRRPKTAPRGRQDRPKRTPKNGSLTSFFGLGSFDPPKTPQDPPRPLPDRFLGRFLVDCWLIFGRFLIDLGSILSVFFVDFR